MYIVYQQMYTNKKYSKTSLYQLRDVITPYYDV